MKDQRGPFRNIEKVVSAWDTGYEWTVVFLSCGHANNMNPIYDYSKEKELRCLKCGQNN